MNTIQWNQTTTGWTGTRNKAVVFFIKKSNIDGKYELYQSADYKNGFLLKEVKDSLEDAKALANIII